MADTADDLSAPLGQETARRKRRLRLPFTAMQALAVLLGMFLVVFAGFALFGDNPLGGEPVVHLALRAKGADEKVADAGMMAPEHAAKSAPKPATSAAEQRTVTIIDGSSGKRQDVVIGGGAQDRPPADKADGDGGAFAVMAGVDSKLLEKTRYDPDRRNGPQALCGLCRASRSGQSGKNACCRRCCGRTWCRRGKND